MLKTAEVTKYLKIDRSYIIPREKHITIILLKEHSNETTPNDILLSPYSKASLSSYQRRFFLKYIVINTEDCNRYYTENGRR